MLKEKCRDCQISVLKAQGITKKRNSARKSDPQSVMMVKATERKRGKSKVAQVYFSRHFSLNVNGRCDKIVND